MKRCDPHIGLLHRGTEKLCEFKTYLQVFNVPLQDITNKFEHLPLPQNVLLVQYLNIYHNDIVVNHYYTYTINIDGKFCLYH